MWEMEMMERVDNLGDSTRAENPLDRGWKQSLVAPRISAQSNIKISTAISLRTDKPLLNVGDFSECSSPTFSWWPRSPVLALGPYWHYFPRADLWWNEEALSAEFNTLHVYEKKTD